MQVAQVLLTLPYSFSQLGMLSGVIFQVFYGILGSWTAYLISVLYVEYRTRKEKENVSFKDHVIQVFSSNNYKINDHLFFSFFSVCHVMIQYVEFLEASLEFMLFLSIFMMCAVV